MILGHTSFPEGIKVIFYSFHMPIFFLLTGYTFSFKYVDKSDFFSKRIYPLLRYYFIFVILNVLWAFCKLIATGEFEVNIVKKYLLGIAINIRGTDFGPGMWFLTSLITALIFFYFLFKNCNSNREYLIKMLSLLVIWITYYYLLNLKLPWAIDIVPLTTFFWQ